MKNVWKWVKGHSGNAGNNRADKMTGKGIQLAKTNNNKLIDNAKTNNAISYDLIGDPVTVVHTGDLFDEQKQVAFKDLAFGDRFRAFDSFEIIHIMNKSNQNHEIQHEKKVIKAMRASALFANTFTDFLIYLSFAYFCRTLELDAIAYQKAITALLVFFAYIIYIIIGRIYCETKRIYPPLNADIKSANISFEWGFRNYYWTAWWLYYLLRKKSNET